MGYDFCDCGVALERGEDECAICAAAPHDRDCGCDVCDAYWAKVAANSARAADEANRALVCTCGWTGPFIEHHDRTRKPGCRVSYRDGRQIESEIAC